MAQIFRPRHNAIAKLSIIFLVLLIFGGGALVEAGKWSSYVTGVGVAQVQPVPFSHKHHAGGLGIDCRYCHTSVEKSATAGMPPTKTCMTCHSQIWTNAKILEPVRESYRANQPLHWERVYALPKYVYFDHHIHVNKGVGCTSCHGQLDQMPMTVKARSFNMRDCLDCHRQPERALRPLDQVFSLTWQPPKDQLEQGAKLARLYHVPTGRKNNRLTDCYTCHR